MGTGPMSVVDPATMRVHGAEGLRVVDASVMPYVTNGNIYAPVMMLAEKAADIIIGRPPLPAGADTVLPTRPRVRVGHRNQIGARQMSQTPTTASVVVIGAGIVGNGLVHHLASSAGATWSWSTRARCPTPAARPATPRTSSSRSSTP